MSTSLPPRPDLEQLKKLAKTLHKQYLAADPAALDRVRRFQPTAKPKSFRLHEAQLVIAREHGFASWPKLKAEVELRLKSLAERADLLTKLATEGQVVRALELLVQEPELSRASFYAACAVGEVDFVEQELREVPALAVHPGGPDRCVPLLYACFSGFLRTDPKRAEQIVRIARLLLEHGADPNSVFVSGSKEEPWRLSALYAAAGKANHAGLTKLLLEAGANPNDGESLYHSAEFKEHACTRLLLEHGAKIVGTNAVHRKLDYDDLAGLRLFLDHGADANLGNHCGDGLIHWAISNGRGVEFIELLAGRGADLRARNSQGLTPFQQASLLGHTAAVNFLEQRGAGDDLSVKEKFLAACARGDEREVTVMLKKNPKLAGSLPAADCGLLPDLAWRGQAGAVRVMLAAGFNIAAKGKAGGTALHCAAWMGQLATVKVLLAAGAPLEVKDRQYDATPLGWAIHGLENSRDSDGKALSRDADHSGVIKVLVVAGAQVSEKTWQEFPEHLRAALRPPDSTLVT